MPEERPMRTERGFADPTQLQGGDGRTIEPRTDLSVAALLQLTQEHPLAVDIRGR